ncbi:two-component system sensor histidine kinase DcuS [Brenneria goodwinii]|uniref:Sensor histidine kinase DcuS n=1 Tax=Brenneria goodwinii TaxID=1109412 RepID=A0A0G4JTK0_9GAMM|nr:sensor histidine kinase [Brenneria goodwinii]ATA26027.1 histidine kinase [Brenneria goodwinii]MCG8157844.1 two-component system sensor histidine kinase DcuS [Brenneria goodwinii]MCG8162852.1 two-component system sensor histidine kinase DcuS [Brenneria goodwinii]MCG8165074.1 two-component system sensor histidine kinase DcuS [Brenneria goodwinii]MCG8171640.1 two-component system sensor histidine kinase DcuS [Brenneria goodwinii]
MNKKKTPLKLGTSVFLMVSAVIGAVLLVVYALLFFRINQLSEDHLREKAFAIARTFASSPLVIDDLKGIGNPDSIQDAAGVILRRNQLLFITVTDMNTIRHTHPEPNRIGGYFAGRDIYPALLGMENSSINRGTLDPALRVFTPVFDHDHRQVGVVAVGIALTSVQKVISENRWMIPWAILAGALVGWLGTLILVKILKRIMLGFEPFEISNLFEQRNAMLKQIKEGVIAVDTQTNITVINDEAIRLFRQGGSQSPDKTAESISQNWLDHLHLKQVLENGIPRRDEEINVHGHLLLTNTVPVFVNGDMIGAIVTFRDKTEISQLLQRLSGMSYYADALRAQSHEFMNKLHVILGMLHLKYYSQLENYILKTANNYQAEIGSIIRKVKSPVIAGFLLGKINRARDLGITLSISEESYLPDTDDVDATNELITVLGNLIENAMDAIDGQENCEISVGFHHQDGCLHLTVGDDGPGILPENQEHIYEQGFSTKGSGRGIGLYLTKQSLEKIGGNIDFESEPEVYTQFFVNIPYQARPLDHD